VVTPVVAGEERWDNLPRRTPIRASGGLKNFHEGGESGGEDSVAAAGEEDPALLNR